jgi:hypothetical protein
MLVGNVSSGEATQVGQRLAERLQQDLRARPLHTSQVS